MGLSRRGVLAGLLAGAVSPAFGEAVTTSLRPWPRPEVAASDARSNVQWVRAGAGG